MQSFRKIDDVAWPADSRYLQTMTLNNYHAETFAVDISRVPWDVVNLSESIDDKLDAFNDLFLACLNEHAPVKTIKIKHRSIPFITEEIKQLFLTKYELHKRARQSHNPNDWMAFRSIKQKVKRSLRQAEIDYYNNEIKSNMDNTGAIWKPIRHALPTNSSSKQCLQYTKETAVLADEFNDFFLQLLARELPLLPHKLLRFMI